MKQGYLIVDIGTGNSRVGIISTDGQLLSVATRDSVYLHDQDFPDSIYFEPETWEPILLELMDQAVAGAKDVQLIGMSASSQRQGIVLISDEGQSLVGYQNGDNRGAEFLGEIDWKTVKELTNLDPMAIYSCVKFLGTMKRQPYIVDKTKYYTSISDWIGFLATGKVVWERSQALQTAVYDIRKGQWSDRLCKAIGVDPGKLPPIAEAGTVLGPVRKDWVERFHMAEDAKFVVGAADTQIALTGSYAETDEVTIVSGTTTPIVKIKETYTPQPCWVSPHALDGAFMLEVNAASTGINLQRFKNLFLPDKSYEELLEECKKQKVPKVMAMFGMCPHNGDVPAFNGGFLLGTTWDDQITRTDFFHALNLDIAMSIVMCIQRINGLDPYEKDYVVGAGGGMRSALICQTVANLSGYEVRLYRGYDQATMLGCMRLCSMALGIPQSQRELVASFQPQPDPEMEDYFLRWKKLREAYKTMN